MGAMVMRMDVVKEDRRCSAAMVIFPPLQFLSVELQTLAPERLHGPNADHMRRRSMELV
jgi:hypothetical protein